MDIDKIAEHIHEAISNNREDFKFNTDAYDRGYTEGYQDALVNMLDWLSVKNDYETFN